MRRTLLATIALLPLAAAPAAAEPLGDADPVHDLHGVDRFTPRSSFGVSLGYLVFDDDVPGIDTVLGFDVWGSYVTPSGAGGYVVLPMSYLSFRDLVVGPIVIRGDSEVALGNLEVGGLYARPLGPTADVVLRFGLALPTADDDGAGAAQALASAPRYGDLVQRWPNSTWARLSASPMGRVGPMFWRVDLGLDLALDDDNANEISPVLRVNVAGGVDLGPADLSIELATNITSSDADDDTASTLAIGARFDGGDVQPGIALLFPIGFDGLEDYLDLAIALSLTIRLP